MVKWFPSTKIRLVVGDLHGGVTGNAVNGMGVTLGGSDLLDLTVRIRVGSHNLSHST